MRLNNCAFSFFYYIYVYIIIIFEGSVGRGSVTESWAPLQVGRYWARQLRHVESAQVDGRFAAV